MRQANLFGLDDELHEPARARNSDPPTSHEAAEKVDANRLEHLVWECLIERGPMMTEQICVLMRMPWKTVSPRLRPLCNKGWIQEAGTARASTGRRVIVWEAKLGR
jgi:hypothetical protein